MIYRYFQNCYLFSGKHLEGKTGLNRGAQGFIVRCPGGGGLRGGGRQLSQEYSPIWGKVKFAQEYEVRRRKNCFFISCPDVSRIFIFFSIRHEIFTLTMMPFLFFGQMFQRIGLFARKFRAKCCARL